MAKRINDDALQSHLLKQRTLDNVRTAEELPGDRPTLGVRAGYGTDVTANQNVTEDVFWRDKDGNSTELPTTFDVFRFDIYAGPFRLHRDNQGYTLDAKNYLRPGFFPAGLPMPELE